MSMSVDVYEVTNIPKKGDRVYIRSNIIKELRAAGSIYSRLEDEELQVSSVVLVSVGCFRVSVVSSISTWNVDIDTNGFSLLFNSTVFETRDYFDEEEEDEKEDCETDNSSIKASGSFSSGSKYNGRCPYCGHQAYNGLFETKCSNRSCEKYSP